MLKDHAKYASNHIGIKVNENEERATVAGVMQLQQCFGENFYLQIDTLGEKD